MGFENGWQIRELSNRGSNGTTTPTSFHPMIEGIVAAERPLASRSSRETVMTRPSLLLAFALCSFWSPSAFAANSEARSLIGDAVEAAREEDRSCRKLVEDMRDVREQLKDAHGHRLKEARRSLRSLIDRADENCPRGVTKKLKRALEALEGDDDRDRDRDDDQVREHRHHDRDDEVVAAQPTAMSPAEFATLRAAINREAFSNGKVGVLQTAAGSSYFTCAQAGVILDLFAFSNDKISALQIMAPRLVDRANAFSLYGHFAFEADKTRARAILGQ
jgi:F0F1-type ATP synthase membrane subunit b/b'